MLDKIERKLAALLPLKLARLHNTNPVLSFTFDDVPQSACTTGSKILEEFGVKATYYLAGSMEDGASPSGRIHDAGDIRNLVAAGHEIGSHGYAHMDFQAATRMGCENDLSSANRYFTGHNLDKVPSNFAYPFGRFGFASKYLCARNFASARGVKSGVNKNLVDLARLRSIPLYDSETGIPALTGLLSKAAQPRHWVIFTSHGVYDEPDQFSCSPDLLRHAVETALSNGYDILPVRNALGATMFRPHS